MCLGATRLMLSAGTCQLDRLALLAGNRGFNRLRQTGPSGTWRAAGLAGRAPMAFPQTSAQSLNRRTAPLLWHLEQAACRPAGANFGSSLRRLLDSGPRGTGLLWGRTHNRSTASVWAFARLRRIGQPRTSLDSDPPSRLVPSCGAPLARMLAQVGTGPIRCGLRQCTNDSDRGRWLRTSAPLPMGEELLMGRKRSGGARSIWSEPPASRWRFDTVLGNRFSKPRRRPGPTPLLPPTMDFAVNPPCSAPAVEPLLSPPAPFPCSAFDVVRRRIGLPAVDPLGLCVSRLPPCCGAPSTATCWCCGP